MPRVIPAPIPGRLLLRPGGMHDYRALERFHYARGRPATVCAVRAIDHHDGARRRVVAVGVLSFPTLASRARRAWFDLRAMDAPARRRWINTRLRTVSRVIVHPQFRALGLTRPILAALCDACPTRFVESAARMGRAHPLFESAGFARVEPSDASRPVYYVRDLESAAAPRRGGFVEGSR